MHKLVLLNAQTQVSILDVYGPTLVIPGPGLLKPFGTGKADKVEQTPMGISTCTVPPGDWE